MKNVRIGLVAMAAIAAIVVIAGSYAQAGDKVYYYPDQDNKVFSVSAPDSWELTPGEEEGDFFMLQGPSGLALSFRAIEPDPDANPGQEAAKYIGESYKNVKMGEARDCQLGGLQGKCVAGTGDSEEGSHFGFEVGWLVLKNGQVAELWTEVEAGDKDGYAEARNILDSFKSY